MTGFQEPGCPLNDTGPGNLVSHQVPAGPNVPPKGSVVGVIPDGSGGVYTCQCYAAACIRVLLQDVAMVEDLHSQRIINISKQGVMIWKLAKICSCENNSMFQNTLQIGRSIMLQYENASPEERLICITHDAELRRQYDGQLRRSLYGLEQQVYSNPPYTSSAPQPYLEELEDLQRLIEINSQQHGNLMTIHQSLLQVQAPGRAQELFHSCSLIALNTIYDSGYPTGQIHSPAANFDRPPLAPVSRNAVVQPQAQYTGALKRKRPDSGPTETSWITSTYDFMVGKKKLGERENAKKAASPSTNATISEYNEHLRQISAKRVNSVARRPTALNSTAPSVVGGSSYVREAADDMMRIVVVSTQGQADFRLKTSYNTPISKVIKAAKVAFRFPMEQTVEMFYNGSRLSPEALIWMTGLKDLATVHLMTTFPAERLTCPDLQQNSRLNPDAPVYTSTTSNMGPVIDLTANPAPSQAQASNARSAITGPSLCKEQQDVVDLIIAGKNVFYTGSAGCGKSTVLKTFVPKLQEMGKNVRIVAPTGKAALDISGTTVWTFAGWTPLHMKKPLADLIKAAQGKFVKKRLTETDVLVVDEISMVENHLFSRLDALMRAARGNDLAFGGVQLIVTGDFTQLPPVKPFQYCIICGREQPQRRNADGQLVYKCPQHGECNDDDKWAFRSMAWENCQFIHVNLSTIHRQSDEVFLKILHKFRMGRPLTQADRQLLLDHPCNVDNAVKLFPTRDQVKRINATEFDKLKSAKHSYTCLDNFRWNKEKHPHLESKGKCSSFDGSLDALREHRLDSLVEYKKGMLVVLLINLDQASGLVNGSQGRIVGFEPFDPAKLPKARREVTDSGSSRSNYSGSRSREPVGPVIVGELRGDYAAMREGQIRWFINHPRNKSKMWPIVEFENGIRKTIYADCQVHELGDEKEYSLLSRTQIPLVAAWAMTIHKSQGMTLDKVIVDLGKSFEEGQEYVALSRARSLEGLQVIALGEGVGKGGNAQVREFLHRKFGL